MNGDRGDCEKLPGNYRPWDLRQLILAGRRYSIEDVGILSDGGAIFAVFVSVVPGMC